MNNHSNSDCKIPCDSGAPALNKHCFCKTLDREKLQAYMHAQALPAEVLQHQEQLFSQTAVFISISQWQQINDLIQAVTRVINLPAYKQHVLAQAPHIAQLKSPTEGVFMGYDFHLSDVGPKIIEINTNAGGGFLNAALLAAQVACCNASEGLPSPTFRDVEAAFSEMFKQEWALARGDRPLTRIAIVDNNPRQQFLYPEFLIAQDVLKRSGIDVIIADASALTFVDKKLMYQNKVIDLVYNRVTDFYLNAPTNNALRSAHEQQAVVLTPNPHHHALFADKRNLVLLSDGNALKELQATEHDIQLLKRGIPHTQSVNPNNADALWHARKKLFFKPSAGFGGRATYRGDKLTKRVWQEILQGDYVAQEQVLPGERGIAVDNQITSLKMDIRAYVYAGSIQLLAARLYQGQTTNFRTQGGGFAPVFVVN